MGARRGFGDWVVRASFKLSMLHWLAAILRVRTNTEPNGSHPRHVASCENKYVIQPPRNLHGTTKEPIQPFEI